MTKIIKTSIPDLLILLQPVYEDERGMFVELFNNKDFNLPLFVQDNVSHSSIGVLRGLHYQDPRPQDKLVTCLRGRIWDVAVDLRVGSPTYGKWDAVDLYANRKFQRYLFVPSGFAHGFVALESSIVHYKCSDYYYAKGSKGIIWNDPTLNIAWPIKEMLLMSPQDKSWPTFDSIKRISKPCPKCAGSSWLSWYELEDYSGPATQGHVDNTKYTCDACMGTGVFNDP